MASCSINIPIQQYFALLLSLHSNMSKLSITGDTIYCLLMQSFCSCHHSHHRDFCNITSVLRYSADTWPLPQHLSGQVGWLWHADGGMIWFQQVTKMAIREQSQQPNREQYEGYICMVSATSLSHPPIPYELSWNVDIHQAGDIPDATAWHIVQDGPRWKLSCWWSSKHLVQKD